MRNRTVSIIGTAMLGALAITFDLMFWTLRIKIPFPLFPRLKFDIDGIPVVLSLLMYGSRSGLITSVILLLIISFRDPFSAFMKALAEFSTIVGMIPFYKRRSKASRIIAVMSGVASRITIMTLSNLTLLPMTSILSWDATMKILPFIVGFNAVAGLISSVGGYMIFEALQKRVPNLTKTN